jgi:hypothetical protein
MHYVCTYKNNGPYFPETIMKYHASSLKDILFHCRLAMEDQEDIIAVFDGDACKGFWENDAEPEPDGEGGWLMSGASYALQRPGGCSPKHFAIMTKKLLQTKCC